MEGIDAIALLREDHKKVKGLFRDFSDAKLNPSRAGQIAEQIIQELVLHAEIEEKLFYPAVRGTVEDVEDVVAESFQEHHLMKIGITEVRGMDPSLELFHAKMNVLIENVKHHIKEEEEELFPKVRDKLGRTVLHKLGALMQQMKMNTSPRPRPEPLDEGGSNLGRKLESKLPSDLREILQGMG